VGWRRLMGCSMGLVCVGAECDGVTVAGRGGVAGDAAAVVLNVTVTDPQASGFVTVLSVWE
jgi:hypothetical protein